MQVQHTSESELTATYMDQFSSVQRSSLASLVFAQGAVILAQEGPRLPYKPAPAIEEREESVEPAAEQQGPQAPTVLGDVDQAILDLLYRMDAPMMGPDIAESIGNSLSYVKERLTKAAPLRAEGLIGNKARVGYCITDAGKSVCS